MAEPQIKEYCQGISSALLMFLTIKGPKDQIKPANKTKNIAELTFFDITYYRTLVHRHLRVQPK